MGGDDFLGEWRIATGRQKQNGEQGMTLLAIRYSLIARFYFTTLTRMMRLVALWWMSRSPFLVALMWRTMPE